MTVITTSVRRRDLNRLQNVIRQADPAAFISVEEVIPLHRGYFRS